MGVVQPYRMLLRPRLAAFEIPDNTLAQRELLVKQAELLHSPQADRLKEQHSFCNPKHLIQLKPNRMLQNGYTMEVKETGFVPFEGCGYQTQ